ncbi:MAG: YtxH domain-containing protein [Sphingobacteriales bacterium]|nr:YtxH domain-containing protein [Sphingobacteriales bacterium]
MKNTSKMLIALGACVAIGGVLGILFAPDKGADTRHKIIDSGKKLKDQLGQKFKMGKEKLKKEMEKANGEFSDVLS